MTVAQKLSDSSGRLVSRSSCFLRVGLHGAPQEVLRACATCSLMKGCCSGSGERSRPRKQTGCHFLCSWFSPPPCLHPAPCLHPRWRHVRLLMPMGSLVMNMDSHVCWHAHFHAAGFCLFDFFMLPPLLLGQGVGGGGARPKSFYQVLVGRRHHVRSHLATAPAGDDVDTERFVNPRTTRSACIGIYSGSC